MIEVGINGYLLRMEQQYDGWCGPAVLAACINAIRQANLVTQKDLARMIGWVDVGIEGTDHSTMLRTAQYFLPNSRVCLGRSIDELVQTKEGLNIVNLMSSAGGKHPVSESGHYIVMADVVGGWVIMADPEEEYMFRALPKPVVEESFWDIDAGFEVRNWALLMLGRVTVNLRGRGG